MKYISIHTSLKSALLFLINVFFFPSETFFKVAFFPDAIYMERGTSLPSLSLLPLCISVLFIPKILQRHNHLLGGFLIFIV